MGKTFHFSVEDLDDEDPNDFQDDEITAEFEINDPMDGDHESALESVYGPEDSYLDTSWEDRCEPQEY